MRWVVVAAVLLQACGGYAVYDVVEDEKLHPIPLSTVNERVEQAKADFLSCEYFTENHPSEAEHLESVDVSVYWSDDPEVAEICGKANIGGDTIWLNIDPFDEGISFSGCSLNRTIPHELLHVAGLSHDNKEDQNEFYDALNACD